MTATYSPRGPRSLPHLTHAILIIVTMGTILMILMNMRMSRWWGWELSFLHLQTLLTSQGQGLICYPEVHKGHNHHRQILIVVTGDSRCWVQGQQWPGIPPQKQNPPLALLSSSSISSPPQTPPPPPPSQNKTPLRWAWSGGQYQSIMNGIFHANLCCWPP